ncbi:MAG: sugar phosphate isomerase/epimerase [Verrucomicrobia bacterium]|nr:sugar phosphate isomerase/epimerase [Verrucomicrobiota bacterium]MBU4291060.1 sugar phosphate isomerase/epimerase [Verrucomicrobiota bacterium]MBU4427844.1 sugar phosphate isomerase/epimerase [Verrucomicrobiota bacterium]MBU4498351.1 sugar phosphate isomerase/epimerase [Verrucomicrobiota bacterium]MCG2679456.1 sugar phosphate isomerase/epimerase [Kiritimatiellia bacterium]
MKLAMMSYTMSRDVKASEFDLAGMCKLARELDLEGVDMVSTYGRDSREIRRLLDDHGLKTVCHTFGADLNQANTAGRCAGLDAVKTGLDAALVLGTDKIMIVTPGKGGVSREVSRRQFIAGLQEAMPLARKAGITITIENFPGAASPFVVSSEVLEAIREVPGLKLTFDNGNVLTGGEDPAESFRKCTAHVVHAHFKDWDVVAAPEGMPGVDGRRYRGALIGEGIVDQRSCLAAMKRAGYTGYINIEYEGNQYPPDEATRRAAAYLHQLMDEIEA